MEKEQQFLSALMSLNQVVGQLVLKTGSIPSMPSYTVAQANALTGVAVGTCIYVVNESGGAQGASFDGTNWRRFTDRNVIS